MIRVVKVGGRAQSDPALASTLARAVREGSDALVIVHGGGDELSALQRATGSTPDFAGGRRVTSDADLPLIRMALSGLANKRLVSALVSEGIAAVGLSGEDGACITARPVDGAAMRHVGAPHEVNVALLCTLLDGGFVPVLSPVSRRDGGDPIAPLNVNADDAAAAVAAALGADELVLVSDVAAVRDDAGAAIAELDEGAATAMIADGSAAAGMAAKLEAAIAALRAGVARVRIGDARAIVDRAAGTMVLAGTPAPA